MGNGKSITIQTVYPCLRVTVEREPLETQDELHPKLLLLPATCRTEPSLVNEATHPEVFQCTAYPSDEHSTVSQSEIQVISL